MIRSMIRMKKSIKKKVFAAFTSAAVSVGALCFVTAAAQADDVPFVSTVLGDVNNDRAVTIADAVAILQFVGNKEVYMLEGQALDNADVFNRGDGVTARDALAIQKLDAKMIESLPESVMEGAPVTTTDTPVTTTVVSSSDTPVSTTQPAEKSTNSITLSGTVISSDAPADAAEIADGVLTIRKEGKYNVSGEGTGVQIVVDVDKNAYPDSVVELDLIGMSITNTETAPIFVNSIGDEVQIVAKSGTVNTISDGNVHSQTYTDSDGEIETVEGAVFSRDDIKFKGTGTLTINGNQDDAIVCKNDIKIYNGNITVNAVDDGIRGKDSVTIGDSVKSDGSAADNSDLKLTVRTTKGDGIKSTATDIADGKSYGVVTINGGTVNISSYSDGIQAAQSFVMNGGEVNISTFEGYTYTASGNTDTTGQSGTQTGNTGWGFPGQGRTGRPGQGGTGGFPGMESGHDLGLEDSCKGIKAGDSDSSIDGSITVNGGTLTIDSTDDAIHCGGTMDINGGSIKISTADDALHCDKYLNISGGTLSITDSYEGLEAMQIRITDVDLTVYVYDDPVNAGEKGAVAMVDVANDNCLVQIDGGIIHAYVTNNREGDGIDSNGKIVINGGEIYVEGSVDGPDSALDSDGEMLVNGGIVVAVGGLGRGELPEQSSKQNSLYWGSNTASYAAGCVVSLRDQSGKELLSYTSEQSLKCVVISSPDIKTGEKYSIALNGNTVADFTVTSALMTQGTTGSSGGGGMR